MKPVSADRAADAAIEWAAGEGWNPGLDDRERFLAADPESFMGVEVDDGVGGTVSCVLYGPRYAFVGFYIVRRELRGRGIGTLLFDQALARAGDRVVGLDGVLEQQPVYASLGFEPAHRNQRWAGRGGGTRPGGLADLAAIAIDDLAAYDAAVFGTPRPDFLRAWIERPAGHALASVGADGVNGYAVLRRCRQGWKAGPLFADSAAVAADLLEGMRAAVPAGEPVFLDVPQANPDAVALAEAVLDEPVFETARMYLNGRPPEDVTRVFGVTSFEFG